MLFGKNDKIVMIGDSITDCERKRPIGEGKDDALGRGYVSLVHALLQARHPELGVRVVNMGISGNTTRHLKERWETDVVQLQPDWISIMIGINDVWRQFDRPTIMEEHVYFEEYRANLEDLVRRAVSGSKGVILMTPYYLEPNTDDAMRRMMDKYSSAVSELATQYGTLFVDTQVAFAPLLEHMYPAALAWDRVHPNMTGHMAIAWAFLNAVEFSW
ncbi:SGNH/GDSL hydrolase family protein [Paenibacillus xerothermodurans]|uniref:GDSL family lipase n=1 Tax=Paenibacillus xerothermodurans TaxID=1977292 RepID=A0A2W1P6W9_PAEXE|nr:SGNH/GDSL hydrolase family protein [Paenibacillus xerothermodurans]PZE22808.1 GDSL family lipase [Paenibacillus xerothermodurans]